MGLGLRLYIIELSVVFRGIGTSGITTYRPAWRVLVSGMEVSGIDAAGLERSILCGIMLLSVGFVDRFRLVSNYTQPESLILAQNERWRHA